MGVLTWQNVSIRSVPVPILSLVVSLVMPIELSFYIGNLLITPSRIVLLVMAFPVIFRLFKQGNIADYEYYLFGFAIWVFISYSINHGISKAIESAGVFSLEVVICYLITRIYINSFNKWIATIKLVVLIVTIISPVVVIESVIGKHYIHDFFSSLGENYYSLGNDVRLGLTRAYGPFKHPILLGVFSSSLIGVVWYTFSHQGKKRLLSVGILTLTTFTSLSSAPIILALLQFFAIFLNHVARRIRMRWKLVVAGFVCLYVFLLFWSSNSPIIVILSKITLNPETSYYRLLIWEYGSNEVVRHPFFGIGLNEWVRPIWMSSNSIDNFWLKQAMFFGIPALICLGLCVITLIRKIIRMMNIKIWEDYILLCQGWLVSIISLLFIGFTVDFFGAIHIYFYFMLGLGATLINMVERI